MLCISIELREISTGLILQVHVQGITRTITGDHTGRHGEDDRILHIGRAGIDLCDHGVHLILLGRTLVPILQTENEHTSGIALTTDQAIACRTRDETQLRDALQPLVHLIQDLVGGRQRATGGCRDIHQDHTLILLGHQAGLRAIHQEDQQHDGGNQQAPGQPTMVDKEQHTVLIFLDDLRESGIEGLTEAGSEVVFLRAILIDVGTQQDGAQRRAQRQGVDR